MHRTPAKIEAMKKRSEWLDEKKICALFIEKSSHMVNVLLSQIRVPAA
jgi:hypothetical protein